MNRYYVVMDKPGLVGRLIGLTGRVAGRRELPSEIGHYRRSVDQLQLVFQAETNDVEHASILAEGGEYLGNYLNGVADAAVHARIASDPTRWGVTI